MAGNLFEELKRRKVFKVGAAYLVVAWLAVQAASIGFPAFGAPEWALRVFILVALLGFPIAVVLAWVFEATPEGMKVEPTQTGTRRIVAVAVVLVALALAWFFKGQVAVRPGEAVVGATSVATQVAPTPAAAVSEQSIAVLPFENLSADPDNAFFATGIQDEILGSLAKVGGLKVISRTSTIKYGARPGNLQQIAKELGVANILEGSVQRAGNRVRVIVQLIDARTDQHRWSETYDRPLDDVFAVQSEVARTIASALKANITPAERAALGKAPTRDAQAYEHFLRGRALLLDAPAYQRQPALESIRELEAAVARDPGFLEAWSDLALQNVWLYFSGLDPTPGRLAKARAALASAVAIAPEAPETDAARSVVLYYGEQRFADALVYARRVQAKRAGDARGHHVASLLARRVGDWPAAEAGFQRGRELSPNDYSIVSELALTLYYQRRYAEALPLIDQALLLQPDDTAMLSIKLPTVWNLQGLAGGRRLATAWTAPKHDMVALRARQAEFERDDARALALYRQAVALPDGDDAWPADFGGYVSTAVDTRLRLAALERRVDPAAGAARFAALLADADAGLRTSDARYAKAAWHAVRGLTLAGLGRKAEAVAAGERAVALVPTGFDALESPAWISYLARIHAINGDAASAVALLRKDLAVVGGLDSPALLRLDPVWDPIRKDPAFVALTR